MSVYPKLLCRCGAPKPYLLSRTCRNCRDRRLFTTRYLSGATLAHAAVSRARAAGVLPDPKLTLCTDCGGPAIEYDHRDYNEPLQVQPVCRRCNLLRGRAIPKRWARGEFAAYLQRALARNQPSQATVLLFAAKFPDAIEQAAA